MNPLLEKLKDNPKGFWTATELIDLIKKLKRCHETEAYSIRDKLVESGEIIPIDNFDLKSEKLRVPWESKQKVWYVLNNLNSFKTFLTIQLEGSWKIRRFYKINTDLTKKAINKIIPNEDRKITEADLDKINDSIQLLVEPFKRLIELLES